MEAYRAYRDIIAGNKLAEVIDLPEELKTIELEIVLFPLKNQNREEKRKPFKIENLPGQYDIRISSTRFLFFENTHYNAILLLC